MLEEVRIRDLALLESVDLRFGPGLNVISGETGEGKSLLLQAIGLLLGSRARRELVRSGAGCAIVEGRFRLDAESARRLAAVCELVTPESREILVRRVVAADGTGRASIDGSLASVAELARIGAQLVDIHGQGETRASLHREEERAAVLDRAGGHEDLARAAAAAAARWRSLEARRRELEASAARREELREFRREQVQELARLDPREDEEAELAAALRLLSRSDQVVLALRDAEQGLDAGDGSATELCARVRRGLRDAGGSPTLADWLRRLEALEIEARDLGREAGRIAELFAGGEEERAAQEARLGALREAARRYRCQPRELPARRQEVAAELLALDREAGEAEGLLEDLRGAREAATAAASELLAARRRAALRLEPLVREGLAELRMERARFRIAVSGPGDACEGDPWKLRVDFLISANPGEAERPIEQVASGGEMARVLLAIKSALAGVHRIPLLVLDEIDAGIGGRVGLPFGRRIARVAAHHQVLVVTHLPQVAAFAATHFRVRKEVREGRTFTVVDQLGQEERIAELAEMLGFPALDAGARRQARALLREAEA
jgi:DNA repair protein RecN (Recombination protein N)